MVKRKSNNSKWWYLLVKKEDFFNETIQEIKTLHDGRDICWIYAELMLLSIGGQGYIRLEPLTMKECRPEEIIGKKINEPHADVRRAINVLSYFGLVEISRYEPSDSDREMFDVVVPVAVNNCKRSSKGAEARRLQRARKKDAEMIQGEICKSYGLFSNVYLLEEQVEYLCDTFGEFNKDKIITMVGLYKESHGDIPPEYNNDFEFCLAEADKA